MDKNTYNLLQKLRDTNESYKELFIIYDNENKLLFEKRDNKLIVKSNDVVYLDGILGFNDICDEPVIVSGYGKSTQYDENGRFYKSGEWESDKLISGIEYDVIIYVEQGQLIFNPDCPSDPYDSSSDFKYLRMC